MGHLDDLSYYLEEVDSLLTEHESFGLQTAHIRQIGNQPFQPAYLLRSHLGKAAQPGIGIGRQIAIEHAQIAT
jgi:hypothetical protein